jgi:hypothetical protein
MKLTDFVITCEKGGFTFAEVSVTSGCLWWKKTTRRMLFKPYNGCWRFMDTGEYTPDLQAEDAEITHLAQRAFTKEI